MSLSRRRRRKQEHRRQHEKRPPPRTSPADDGVAARFSPERLFEQRALEEPRVAAPQGPGPDESDSVAGPPAAPSPGLREVQTVERLAYSRRQAAEALGVSISTIDRHVVPAIETVKTPWGQRLIPVDQLERLLRTHREHVRGQPARRHAGRPPTLPRTVIERIRLEYARGRGLSEIARALTADGVPTAHGGRKWWPSTVRAVLVRCSLLARPADAAAGGLTD
jgi:hypothetical protein